MSVVVTYHVSIGGLAESSNTTDLSEHKGGLEADLFDDVNERAFGVAPRGITRASSGLSGVLY